MNDIPRASNHERHRMSGEQFVLVHDDGMFGPFPSREAAFDFAHALCTDPSRTYGYEAWPMQPPGAPPTGQETTQ